MPRFGLAHSSASVRLSDPLFYPARSRLQVESGTVQSVLVGSGSVPAYRLDDALTTVLSGLLTVPTGVTRVNAELLLAQTGTDTNNFRLRVDHGTYGDTDAIGAVPSAGTAQSVAAPGVASRLFTFTMLTNEAVDATKTEVFRIVRLGSDGADTSASNLYVIGLRLRPS